MKTKKLMDDLRNLLARMQEMETEAYKEVGNISRVRSHRIAYYNGQMKTCEIFKRRLTEILYEAKVERMKKGDVEEQ